MKSKIFITIFILFLASRFLGFGQIYHQDEYKWAMIVNPVFGLQSESNHPPLVALLYSLTGEFFGYDKLRVLPIIFSFLTLLLVWLLTKKLYGEKAALWTTAILGLSAYNFIASLQIDIDGTLLPFFGLLLYYAVITFWEQEARRDKIFWASVALVATVGGFLTKLSFLLWLAAVASEYFLIYRPSWKIFKKAILGLAAIIVVTSLGVWLIDLIFPVARVGRFLSYINNFSAFNFYSRNYFQVLFLTVKSLVLASPLLLGGYFLINKQNFKKYRFWLIFLLYNFLFYFIIFDFSSRTMERYLMFLIIPGAVIIGSAVADFFTGKKIKNLWLKILAVGLGWLAIDILIMKSAFKILPLNPKSAFLSQLKNFDFNFLIPITGGSGPVGFYAPVLLAVVIFSASFGALLIFRLIKKENYKIGLILIFLIGGIFYNIILDAEFLFGYFYGNVNYLAKQAVNYAVDNNEISQVVTYYDLGGYELNLSGKYQRRFYTDPAYEAKNQKLIPQEKNFYLVVDFPAIGGQSFYWRHFNSCLIDKSWHDKKISAYIFDCRQAKN
ncbi:MAG: glycosyltransferase family 39 protein [bacterium]|nr:glycosyltransferase family 39 protein [bacterium]